MENEEKFFDEDVKDVKFVDRDYYYRLYKNELQIPIKFKNHYGELAKKLPNLKRIQVPIDKDNEFYLGLREFVKNCNDDLTVQQGYISPVGVATKEEFLKGEEIIQKEVDKINTNWNREQKIAHVHYRMGDMISYYPDFNFDGRYVGDRASHDVRNIWKSVADGVSVCNGIAAIELTILSRVGVPTKILHGSRHVFLLHELERGNLLTDATWDLAQSLYQAKPLHFCFTYEQIREMESKQGRNSHELEEVPENIIGIEENELREICYSIGITNEDRTFKLPIKGLVDEINSGHFENKSEKEIMFLRKFLEHFPREATHLSETRSMLECCLADLGIEGNIETKFVYEKEDNGHRNKILAIHINEAGMKDSIRIMNLQEMKFENIGIKEFDKKYRVHQRDTAEPFWKKYLPQQEMGAKETELQQ